MNNPSTLRCSKLVIAQTIPDSLLVQIHHFTTPLEMWNALAKRFEPCTDGFKAGLRGTLSEIKYVEGDDVKKHFEKLSDLREKIAGTGEILHDDAYLDALVDSLPDSYRGEISQYVSQARADAGEAVNSIVLARDVTDMAIAKYERELSHPQVATSTPPCTPTQAPNIVTEDRGDKGVIAHSQPDPTQNECTTTDRIPNTTHPPTATIESGGTRNEVYSTSAPHHMSPHRNDFVSFSPIEPIPLTNSFGITIVATGIGDVPIIVPDGRDGRPTILKNALHVPDLLATVVSLPQLGKEWGAEFQPADRNLTVKREQDGQVIASIPVFHGLHQVSREVLPDRFDETKAMYFSFTPSQNGEPRRLGRA